jgi:hypothetical protein
MVEINGEPSHPGTFGGHRGAVQAFIMLIGGFCPARSADTTFRLAQSELAKSAAGSQVSARDEAAWKWLGSI